MAIKRCPYCRALIDEKEQYCNNCGTQLLFPEDGAIEEEIPGEKIIDADGEEKDYEIPEPGADKPVEDPEDEDEDDLDPDEKPGPGDDEAPEDEDEDDDEDEEPEEVVLVDNLERDDVPELPLTTKPGTSEIPVIFSTPGTEEPEAGEEPKPEREEIVREPEAEVTPLAPSKKPLTFDTSDLDKIGRTAELGKEQVENFLEVLKEREEANRLGRVVVREPEESLPPWAEGIKDGGAAPTPEMKVEMMREDVIEDREPEEPETVEDEDTGAGLEEREPPRPPRPRVADSGMGLPEKVAQAALPFEREIPRVEESVRPARSPAPEHRPIPRDDEETEELEEEKEERPRPPFRLSVFLKAKSFDVLFVAVFWLVSLWIAARSMDATLFRMLGVASSGLLAYFGALLVLYFFLFYFFLGETLGDRLFRDED
jgi:hypothetical protein